MCLPAALMALIPSVLSAGGAVASYFGNKEASNAQSAAVMAERNRQQQLTQRQDVSLNNSMDATKDVQGKGLDDANKNRQQAFIQALAGHAPTQDYLPGSASADSSVALGNNQIVGAEHADASQQADARSRMEGLGDALFKTNVTLGRNAQDINQIGGFKYGSAQVLPAELQAAAQKGSLLRGIGGLLGGFASSGLAGGLGGLKGGGGSPVAPHELSHALVGAVS